jgi:hypothetical protein
MYSLNRCVLDKNYFKTGMKYICKNKIQYVTMKLLAMKYNRCSKWQVIVWVSSFRNDGMGGYSNLNKDVDE